MTFKGKWWGYLWLMGEWVVHLIMRGSWYLSCSTYVSFLVDEHKNCTEFFNFSLLSSPPPSREKKKNKSYLPLSFSNNLFIFLAHFASYLDSFSSCLIFHIRLTALIMAEPKSLLYLLIWASLGTWWWRIRLPVQKMWVHSLGWEDPLD